MLNNVPPTPKINVRVETQNVTLFRKRVTAELFLFQILFSLSSAQSDN